MTETPYDRGFNAAVLHAARVINPCGVRSSANTYTSSMVWNKLAHGAT